MTLVGVGHALADAFAFVEEDVPKMLGLHPGSFAQVPDYRMRAILATLRNRSLMAGGSAANTAKLAARLGVDASFVGQCGHDEAAQVFESELLQAGVKVSLTRVDAPTGLCVTFLSPEAGRTMATFRSASGGLSPGILGATLLAAADVVVAEGWLLDEGDFFDDLMARCRAAGKKVALDVAYGALSEKSQTTLLRHLPTGVIHYFFVSEADAATLGLDLSALEALAQKGVTVVKKEESWGVDPSGSDDGFQAGFLWATGLGQTPTTARKIADLVAACVTEEPGTRVPEDRWKRLQAEVSLLLE